MHGVRPRHSIQKEASAVVDLVLQRTGFESVGRNLDVVARSRQLPGNGDQGRPLDAGELRYRHATFPAFLVATRLDDFGVDQHDQTVRRPGLGVSGHIDAERLGRDANLRRR